MIRYQDRELDEACALVIAETAEPCRHGHYDCALIPAGPCSGEALAIVAAAFPGCADLDEIATRAERHQAAR